MQNVNPKFYILGASRMLIDNVDRMLKDIGAEGWHTNAVTEAEALTEIAGRMCYKSFGTELNPNITKVREGNHDYIGNILKTRHGSILEHTTVTVAFLNVSRIFTHELCRHRAGCAFSQESMRFVRMDDLPIWVPDLSPLFHELADYNRANVEDGNNAAYARRLQEQFEGLARHQSNAIEGFTRQIGRELDAEGVPFRLKKAITSALRRLAPGGHATNIVVTANHRAWRHIFELRTELDPNGELIAEREIHEVICSVGEAFRMDYPAIYQDMIVHRAPSGNDSLTFIHSKI